MFDLRVLFLVCLLVCGITVASSSPVFDPMLKVMSDYGEQTVQNERVAAPMEKRRWLFPTQKSMSPLYPTTDCTEDLSTMINQFRRMPRGKDRDAMIAAIYSYCNSKNV